MKFRAIWDVAPRLVKVGLILGCTAISGLIGAEVVSRSIFGHPLMFVEDIAIYSIVWVYMLGAIYGTYEQSHLKGGIMTMLLRRHPEILKRLHAANAVISLGFCSLLSTWAFQSFLWDLSTKPRTQVLFLPLEYARLSLFVGFSLMAIYFLRELIGTLQKSSEEPTPKC